MKAALFVVLLAAAAPVGAQSGVLVSSLPEGYDTLRVLEVAREVLIARGWTLAPSDQTTLDARKDNSKMRVFVGAGKLRFTDQSVRDRGQRQREHRQEGRQLSAVPQAEIEGLSADLANALGGGLPGQVLVAVPAGVDPEEVMKAARGAFVGRRWAVKDEADGGFVADIYGAQDSATLKVVLAEGALRFLDRSTDRKGQRSQAPERWLNNIRADLRRTMVTLAPRQERGPITSAPAPARGDMEERLRTLQSLFAGGLITQAEYEAKRAEILKGL